MCKLCQTWPPEKLPLRSCPMELRELPLVNLPIYLRVVEDGQMPSSMASRQALLKLANATEGSGNEKTLIMPGSKYGHPL